MSEEREYCAPEIYQRRGTPNSFQQPFSSPSLSRPHIAVHLDATVSPHSSRTVSRASPKLRMGFIRDEACDKQKTDPVAKMITSAAVSVPSSKAIPVLVILEIPVPFLILIRPSAMSLLAPESGMIVRMQHTPRTPRHTYIISARAIHHTSQHGHNSDNGAPVPLPG